MYVTACDKTRKPPTMFQLAYCLVDLPQVIYFLFLWFFGPWQGPEGSYGIGSTHPVHLSGLFLEYDHYFFQNLLHGVRNPYLVL